MVRRHPALTRVSVATAMIAVVALVISNALISEAYRQEADHRKAAESAAAEECRERLEADHIRGQSEEDFDRAVGFYNRILDRLLKDERFHAAPLKADIRRIVAEEFIPFYQGFAAKSPVGISAMTRTARAFQMVGSLHAVLGEHEQAVKSYEAARSWVEQLITSEPNNLRYLPILTEILDGLCSAYAAKGDDRSQQLADRLRGQAIREWECIRGAEIAQGELVELSDRYWEGAAKAAKDGNLAQAAGLRVKATETLDLVTEPARAVEVAQRYHYRGKQLADARNWSAAAVAFRKSMAAWELLVADRGDERTPLAPL